MYYIRINPENSNKITYYCRKCGNEDKILASQNTCISKTYIKKSTQSFQNFVNKYTKLDPTLPRINTVLCPNNDCATNKEVDGTAKEEREIIYIRYDDTNMKYIYLCSTCDTVWQTNETH